MQTFNGPNTAGMRMESLTQGSVDVWVEEEKSKDNEVNHLGEDVAYMAIWTSMRPNQPELEFGQIDLDHNWKTVNLQKTFNNPVVIMGALSYNGGHPSTLRVRNVQESSFEVRVNEWMYLDNWHTTE
jgi:hypothetical protein